MSPERFDYLLGLVENSILWEDTNFRKAISAGEMLAVTLRFLTSGELQQLLSFASLIGKSPLNRIMETCDCVKPVIFASSFINGRMGKYCS